MNVTDFKWLRECLECRKDDREKKRKIKQLILIVGQKVEELQKGISNTEWSQQKRSMGWRWGGGGCC